MILSLQMTLRILLQFQVAQSSLREQEREREQEQEREREQEVIIPAYMEKQGKSESKRL